MSEVYGISCLAFSVAVKTCKIMGILALCSAATMVDRVSRKIGFFLVIGNINYLFWHYLHHIEIDSSVVSFDISLRESGSIFIDVEDIFL